MIFRRAGKNFFKIIYTFCLIFACLQFELAQNWIINLFTKNNVNIQIYDTRGIFPLYFSAQRVLVEVGESVVDISNLHVNIDNIFAINQLKIKQIKITKKKSKEFSFEKIESIFVAFCQKYVKNIIVQEVKFNDFTIKNFCFHAKKNAIKLLKCSIGDARLSSKIYQKQDKIFLDSQYGNLKFQIVYAALNKKILFDFNDIVKFEGKVAQNSINGTLKLSKFQEHLLCDIFCQNGGIEMLVKRSGASKSAKIQYNFANKLLLFDDISIFDGIAIKSFGINKSMKIKNIDIDLWGGKIGIRDVNLSKKDFSLGVVKIDNVDISKSSLEKLDFSGKISGQCSYKSGEENFDLKINNIHCFKMKIPSLKLSGKYSCNKIELDAKYKILQKDSKVHLSIDLNKWKLHDDSKFNLNGNGVFIARKYINIGNENLINGELVYSINGEGAVSQPVFFGKIDFGNINFINSKLGIYIKNGTINANIENNKIKISKIHCIDDSKKPGYISGNGEIVVDKKGIAINSSLNIENFEIISQKEMDGKLFGNVKIRGDFLKKIKITGNLFVNHAKYDMSNVLVANSFLFNRIKKDSHSKVVKNGVAFKKRVELDVHVDFQPYLKIFGNGIHSIWTGSIDAFGCLSHFDYKGMFVLKNGNVNVAGKKFHLKNGKILLDSNNKKIFDIDISAIKKLDNLVVGAKFVKNKQINDIIFFSRPTLSHRDILSYLLFEKKASDISANESLSVVSAISNLAGGSVLNIFDKIQTVLGVDISIKQSTRLSGEKYEAMRIGKNIGKFKISIDQELEQNKTTAMVDVDLKKNVKLSVNIDKNKAAGIGLFWNKRY